MVGTDHDEVQNNTSKKWRSEYSRRQYITLGIAIGVLFIVYVGGMILKSHGLTLITQLAKALAALCVALSALAKLRKDDIQDQLDKMGTYDQKSKENSPSFENNKRWSRIFEALCIVAAMVAAVLSID